MAFIGVLSVRAMFGVSLYISPANKYTSGDTKGNRTNTLLKKKKQRRNGVWSNENFLCQVCQASTLSMLGMARLPVHNHFEFHHHHKPPPPPPLFDLRFTHHQHDKTQKQIVQTQIANDFDAVFRAERRSAVRAQRDHVFYNARQQHTLKIVADIYKRQHVQHRIDHDEIAQVGLNGHQHGHATFQAPTARSACLAVFQLSG
jgi:hypothetical protein